MHTDPATEVSETAEVWRTGTRIYVADTATDPLTVAILDMDHYKV